LFTFAQLWRLMTSEFVNLQTEEINTTQQCDNKSAFQTNYERNIMEFYGSHARSEHSGHN